MRTIILGMMLLATQVASATTYYVSPAGNNANNGSIEKPFRTISFGVSKLKAGDFLYLREGTYREEISFQFNGTAENRITISGYPGEKAVIDGEYTLPESSVYHFLVKITGDYVTLKDLSIIRSKGGLVILRGDYNHGINIEGNGSYESGIVADGDHCLLESCTMTDNGNHYGIGGQTTWGSAIELSGYAGVMQNCVAYDNRGEGLKTGKNSRNCIIQDCISYDNYSCGIYVVSARGSIIRRNIVYCTENARYRPSNGINIGNEYVDDPGELQIYNNLCLGNFVNLHVDSNVSSARSWSITHNTFVNSQKTPSQISRGYNMGVYFRPQLVSFSNSEFKNNIVIEEGSNLVPINADLTYPHEGLEFSNNCWNTMPAQSARGEGDIIADPLITREGATGPGELTADFFKLLETSPVIDKGVIISEIDQDYFGSLRDETPDIGAVEYISSSSFIEVSGITVFAEGGSAIISRDKGTLQLDVSIIPTEATNKSVSWSVDNGSGKATINSGGMLTAVSNGTVTARATAEDGSGVYGSLLITISNQIEPEVPVFLQSVIEKEDPGKLIIRYSVPLAISIPDESSFSVKVNDMDRSLTNVSISDEYVLLSLLQDVQTCDDVSVAYTRPDENPIKSLSGGLASSVGPQTVINKMCAVNTQLDEIKFVIYPNPAKDHISIDMGSNVIMPESITISNMSGSIMLEKIITKDMRFLHIPLDLVDGMYICNFYASGTTIGSQKLIIRN